MSESYLLLGGNIGETSVLINNATELIELLCGRILKRSSLYQSESWGFKSENPFLNQVILIETTLEPEELLKTILSIEQKMGRERNATGAYQSRLIDIDILFYENIIINTETLKIPHPLLHKRRFTLMPLNEIAKDYIHPVLLKSINQLLTDCDDELIVKPYQH